MLPPIANNFSIEFSENFFQPQLVEKYNDYLFHLNAPVKDIKKHIHESIETLSLPGLNLNVVETSGLKNHGSPTDNLATTATIVFPKNQSLIELLEINKFNLTCKNTIINWSYFYEFFKFYTKRGKGAPKLDLTEFSIDVIIRDAGNIPVLIFTLRNCFSASLPPLDFTFNNTTLGESKTIDVGFWFNFFDAKLIIPEFFKTNKNS